MPDLFHAERLTVKDARQTAHAPAPALSFDVREGERHVARLDAYEVRELHDALADWLRSVGR